MSTLERILDLVEGEDVEFRFHQAAFGAPAMRIEKPAKGKVYKWECILATRKDRDFETRLEEQIKIGLKRLSEAIAWEDVTG